MLQQRSLYFLPLILVKNIVFRTFLIEFERDFQTFEQRGRVEDFATTQFSLFSTLYKKISFAFTYDVANISGGDHYEKISN